MIKDENGIEKRPCSAEGAFAWGFLTSLDILERVAEKQALI
jgi:hypothetical protein